MASLFIEYDIYYGQALISVNEKRVVISKDLDFIESLLISDKPYKLIYISTRNIINTKLLELFSKNIEKIVSSIEHNRLIEVTDKNIVINK